MTGVTEAEIVSSDAPEESAESTEPAVAEVWAVAAEAAENAEEKQNRSVYFLKLFQTSKKTLCNIAAFLFFYHNSAYSACFALAE